MYDMRGEVRGMSLFTDRPARNAPNNPSNPASSARAALRKTNERMKMNCIIGSSYLRRNQRPILG